MADGGYDKYCSRCSAKTDQSPCVKCRTGEGTSEEVKYCFTCKSWEKIYTIADLTCADCPFNYCLPHAESHSTRYDHRCTGIPNGKYSSIRVGRRTCPKHQNSAYTSGCSICYKTMCDDCVSEDCSAAVVAGMDSTNSLCEQGGLHKIVPLSKLAATARSRVFQIRIEGVSQIERLQNLEQHSSARLSDFDEQTQQMRQLIHDTRDRQLAEITSKYEDMESCLMSSREESRSKLESYHHNEIQCRLNDVKTSVDNVKSLPTSITQVDVSVIATVGYIERLAQVSMSSPPSLRVKSASVKLKDSIPPRDIDCESAEDSNIEIEVRAGENLELSPLVPWPAIQPVIFNPESSNQSDNESEVSTSGTSQAGVHQEYEPLTVDLAPLTVDLAPLTVDLTSSINVVMPTDESSDSRPDNDDRGSASLPRPISGPDRQLSQSDPVLCSPHRNNPASSTQELVLPPEDEAPPDYQAYLKLVRLNNQTSGSSSTPSLSSGITRAPSNGNTFAACDGYTTTAAVSSPFRMGSTEATPPDALYPQQTGHSSVTHRDVSGNTMNSHTVDDSSHRARARSHPTKPSGTSRPNLGLPMYMNLVRSVSIVQPSSDVRPNVGQLGTRLCLDDQYNLYVGLSSGELLRKACEDPYARPFASVYADFKIVSLVTYRQYLYILVVREGQISVRVYNASLGDYLDTMWPNRRNLSVTAQSPDNIMTIVKDHIYIVSSVYVDKFRILDNGRLIQAGNILNRPFFGEKSISVCPAASSDCIIISDQQSKTISKLNINTGLMMWTSKNVPNPLGVACDGEYVAVSSSDHQGKATICILDFYTGVYKRNLRTTSTGPMTSEVDILLSGRFLIKPGFQSIHYYELISEEDQRRNGGTMV